METKNKRLSDCITEGSTHRVSKVLDTLAYRVLFNQDMVLIYAESMVKNNDYNWHKYDREIVAKYLFKLEEAVEMLKDTMKLLNVKPQDFDNRNGYFSKDFIFFNDNEEITFQTSVRCLDKFDTFEYFLNNDKRPTRFVRTALELVKKAIAVRENK